jgi:hypothetical protein
VQFYDFGTIHTRSRSFLILTAHSLHALGADTPWGVLFSIPAGPIRLMTPRDRKGLCFTVTVRNILSVIFRGSESILILLALNIRLTGNQSRTANTTITVNMD